MAAPLPTDPYLVISADCHAGLPNEEYREWLDPEFREPFDEAVLARARQQEMAAQGILNTEFAGEWNAENSEGLRGGWDAERRDAVRRSRALGHSQRKYSDEELKRIGIDLLDN